MMWRGGFGGYVRCVCVGDSQAIGTDVVGSVGTALPVCRTARRRSADGFRSIQHGRRRPLDVNLCLDVNEAASIASCLT